MGIVIDDFTKRALPFASVKSSNITTIADINGRFTIQRPNDLSELTAETPIHKKISKQTISGDSITLFLNQTGVQFFESATSYQALSLIQNVLRFAFRNDPQQVGHYAYKSYNKLIVNTEDLTQAQNQAKGILRQFGFRINFPNKPHHLFLMESATQRFQKSRFSEKEEVINSKAVGLNSPPPISIASGLQTFSIYKSFLNIAGSWFISPLGGNPFKRYHFNILDTLRNRTSTTYLVHFNPKGSKLLETTAGYLWIDSASLGVQAFHISPALMGSGRTSVYQLNTLSTNNRWMPAETMTIFELNNLLGTNIPLFVKNKTYLFDYQFNQNFKNVQFDHVVIDFLSDTNSKTNQLPLYRKEAFSDIDTTTVKFYEQLSQFKNIDNVVNFGTRLSQGRFPANKFDIVLNKAYKVNNYEGVRLGLGFETSNKFSVFHKIGGYFGYGIADNGWKYGLEYRRSFLDPRETWLEFKGSSDIVEPGSIHLPFPRTYFNNENIRSLLITRYDLVKKLESSLGFTPLPNLQIKSGFAFSNRETLYDYTYNFESKDRNHTFFDWIIAARYSPGERFIRIKGEKLSIGNRWPEVWAQFTKGFDGPLGNHNYVKLDTRLATKFRVLGLGETGINMTAGWINRPSPYPVLYNARGSFRDFSFVSFNSFETMVYNEFTSSEYINFFIVHRFRRIYIPDFPFRPYFSILANFGWGLLKNQELHQGILVQDYHRGYYESGFFVNDIFVINLFGLRLGLGAGAFIRMGHYKQPNSADNVLFKFALNYSF